MSALAVAYPRPRPRIRHDKPLDNASRALLRSAMADTWQPQDAAESLLELVHDDRRVLRLLRARVARALLHRPTQIAARASATLDCALASTDRADRAAGIPQQRGGDRA